jgi:hypothetical protein
MIVTTQGYSFAIAAGGSKFHKIKDGSKMAQCGFMPSGKRGKWDFFTKTLPEGGRTCLRCLLQPSLEGQK